MSAESAQLRACEVALAALYLRGGLHGERIERRRWISLSSALRRRGPSVETLATCARQEGFHDEAVVLDSPNILRWAETLVGDEKVVTALHAGYPSRWLKVLSTSAPPVLWKLGRSALDPSQGAVAVVGSRQVKPPVRHFAREVGRAAAGGGLSLFSGNALGCDIEAMRGAAAAGGRVVAILPHGIDRLERKVSGAEYWSVCAPDEEFSRATAMERNALIYASSACSIVVHARLREGGTWHGAIDAHRRKLTRLVVRIDEKEPGNRALIALGAMPLRSSSDLLTAFGTEWSQTLPFE